jgi:ankyrin repeat protein
MIQRVVSIKTAKPGKGWELLEGVLEDLKNGDNTTINKQDAISSSTALHFAATINDSPEIVEVLLTEGADLNLMNAYSWIPLHIALMTSSFNTALVLLKTNKHELSKLEAAVMGITGSIEKITALRYAKIKAAAGNKKADWQAMVKVIEFAGATE